MKIVHIYLLTIFLGISTPLLGYDYRILVLPSGGCTAINEALLIRHIEQETEKKVPELFDEIWCSSAGAIIAALLTTPHTAHYGAHGAIQFFKEHFSSYRKAYYICSALRKIIGTHAIQNTSIPLKVLTAASLDHHKHEWDPYDFSSDGGGSCPNNQLPLADIVQASCTVYPYLYRNPVTLMANEKNSVQCIDPGSLCCNEPMCDPTAYFLKQLLPRLHPNDTVRIYFLGNAFTQSVNYESLEEVLTAAGHTSWSLFHEGAYSPEQKQQIQIITIPMNISPEEIVARYLDNASVVEKTKCTMVKRIFEKVVGTDNAAPNMLAAGVVPLSILEKESATMINRSKNLHTMLEVLSNTNHS